jgi:putative oxidoreductase
MLNPFPGILVYSLFAPFILRLTLGFIFIRFGALALSSDKHRMSSAFEKFKLRPGNTFALVFGIIELLSGLSLVLGFYTQIGALVSGVISFIFLLSKLYGKPFIEGGFLFDFILLSIALSLLFSGAGFLAFDRML